MQQKFLLCYSTFSSGRGFSSKSKTRQPRVSNHRRWSREKWRAPWKCRRISYGPCISTDRSLGQLLQQKRDPSSIGGRSNEEKFEFFSGVWLLHFVGFLAKNILMPKSLAWFISTRVCYCVERWAYLATPWQIYSWFSFNFLDITKTLYMSNQDARKRLWDDTHCSLEDTVTVTPPRHKVTRK